MQDVSGAMKKEIHRMELRKSELARTKEQLIKELERSIAKRDSISVKGRANMANSKKQGGKLTEKQLVKKCEELHRSISDTDAECTATGSRIATLDRKRSVLAEQMELASVHCSDLRSKDETVSGEVQEQVLRQTALLIQTDTLHQAATALEEIQSGAGQVWVPPEGETVAGFLATLEAEQAAIRTVVQEIGQEHPAVLRTLMHADAMAVL